MANIIYLLTNQAMPNLVKIGKTDNLERRMKELYKNSSIPFPFECYYACEVEDADNAEKKIHDGFADNRVNPKREFFHIHPERIASILKIFQIKNVTPTEDITENEVDQKALNNEKTMRSKFKFSMFEIEKGAELSFIKDENIKATVINDKEIEFRGKATTTSAATKEIMTEMGHSSLYYQGPAYWTYEGEALTDRRFRMENED